MLRIAILDDDESDLEKEAEITEKYFKDRNIPYKLEVFQNAEWFLMGMKEDCYDLYILDVEMPETNGLEVARKIRKLYPEPVIIFITNYMDYAIDAYEVNTYRYIPKIVLETKLTEAYNALLPEVMEKEERYYVIEKRGEAEKIAYSDIFYLRREGKNVVFVHRRGESRVRKSLTQVRKELDSDEFIVIDKGFVVNIRHVMKLKSHNLYMRDGMILDVGYARFGEVKQAILNYWRKK